MERAVVYILSADLRIVYCNIAWDIFAAENGGARLDRSHILGTLFLEAVPEPLYRFYAHSFAELQKSGSGVWEHDFECSSPKLYRLFHMRVLRLSNSYLLIENSLRLEEPHRRTPPPDEAFLTYVNEYGILTMCCHCRRTRRIGHGKNADWDWIPTNLLRRTERISHGLCKTCKAYFYPEVQSDGSAIST
jgi:hypothetical protein